MTCSGLLKYIKNILYRMFREGLIEKVTFKQKVRCPSVLHECPLPPMWFGIITIKKSVIFLSYFLFGLVFLI